MPNSVNRTSNYFGKSNCGNSNVDAIYDEIKIYQGALKSGQIMSQYIRSSTSGSY